MCPVIVPVNLAVLQERVLLYLLLEGLDSNKVVFPAIHLSLSWVPGGEADTQLEEMRVIVDDVLDDSSLHNQLHTLPTPEQPLITSGLCFT